MKLKNYNFSEETEQMLIELKKFYGCLSEAETLRMLIFNKHHSIKSVNFGVMKNHKIEEK